MGAPMSTAETSQVTVARLRDHISAHCFVAAKDEFLADKKGDPQAWLLDLRIALTNGACLAMITECFWNAFAQFWPFQLAAQETAGVPILGALLLSGAARGLPVTGVIVRRERKTYGRQRLIEGHLTSDPVVLVDDLFNSGNSLKRAARILAGQGATLGRVFSIIDFETTSGYAALGALDTGIDRLLTLDDLGLAGMLHDQSFERNETPLRVLWRFEPGECRYSHVSRKSAPVIAEDRVLHATEDGYLHALDPSTGRVLWSMIAARHNRKGVWSTPCVQGGRVFLGSYDGAVFGIDLRTGQILWRFEGADWVGSSPCVTPEGTRLFIGLEHAIQGGSGSIACLDAATGQAIWDHPVPAMVHASPALCDSGTIVCGANDGLVRCLAQETGDPVWQTDVGGAVKGGIAVHAERLYVGSCNGMVTALDAATGTVPWRFDAGAAVFHTPLLHRGHVVVATTGGLVLALDEAGHLVARRKLPGKLFAAPVPAGESLFVGSTTGSLTRLRWPDLAIVSEHQFSERIVSEIAVRGESIFVPTFDGQLFAVESKKALLF